MTKSKFQNPCLTGRQANQSSKSKSLNYWDLNDSFEICHLDLGF